MDRIWAALLTCVLVFAAGGVIGWFFRDLYDMVDELFGEWFEDDEPVLGPTQGSYADPEAPKPPTIHVINPKSPAQVQWEHDNKPPDIMKPE